jgi:adenylate cyclase
MSESSLIPWNGRSFEKPAIAVLPFINLSGDIEQDYFSDGITEDLITDLSKISGLFVVARNSSFTCWARLIGRRNGRSGHWPLTLRTA